jgi:hypothetical protein
MASKPNIASIILEVKLQSQKTTKFKGEMTMKTRCTNGRRLRKNKRLKSTGAYNRVLAAMLTLVLVLSFYSPQMATFALDEVSSPGTQESGQELLENGDDLLTSGVGMWVLQQLAAGAVSYIGGMAMEEAMGQMFGKPPDQISSLVREFQEMKKDIRNIKSQIDNLSAKIDQANLKNDLRTYATLINGYAGVYEHLCGSLDAYSDDDELTELFLTELYKASDENFKVDGKSIIEATLALGNHLTTPYLSNNYNTFGAFDNWISILTDGSIKDMLRERHLGKKLSIHTPCFLQ